MVTCRTIAHLKRHISGVQSVLVILKNRFIFKRDIVYLFSHLLTTSRNSGFQIMLMNCITIRSNIRPLTLNIFAQKSQFEPFFSTTRVISSTYLGKKRDLRPLPVFQDPLTVVLIKFHRAISHLERN